MQVAEIFWRSIMNCLNTGIDYSGRLWSVYNSKYLKLDWTLFWVTCFSWPCFEQGSGQHDLKRCLPTPTILWNHERVPYPVAPSSHCRFPISATLVHSLLTSPLVLYIASLFLHTHILPDMYSHTLHTHPSQLTYNILNPNHLLSSLVCCYLLDLPLPILCCKSKRKLAPLFSLGTVQGVFLSPWVSHLPPVVPLWSSQTYSIPEKRRQVAEKFLSDAGWKTSSAVSMSRELSCLHLSLLLNTRKLCLFKGLWAALR